MRLTDVDFSTFPPEREETLKNIKRYSMFGTMLYRPSLWQHVHRVHWIIDELTPLLKGRIAFDAEKARVLALVHDDAEMVTGDIQAGHKAKMSKEALQALEGEEEKAARTLADTYPKDVHGYDYHALLIHAVRKDCVEAQLVSYADRFDAYCETLHEILAGNTSLLWSLMLYERWLPTYTTRFPALAPMKELSSPFIVVGDNRFQPSHVEAKQYAWLGVPHTETTLARATDFAFYNAWRAMVQRRGGAEGEGWLLEQKEFLPTT